MTRNMLWSALLAITISAIIYYTRGAWEAKWIADSLVLGVWAGMTWTWTRVATRSLTKARPDGVDKIIGLVWLSSAMILVQRVYTIAVSAFTTSDGVRPLWLTESFIPQLIATLFFLAGLFGLFAQSDQARDLPRRQYLTVMSGWFVAGIVTGAAAVYLLIAGF